MQSVIKIIIIQAVQSLTDLFQHTLNTCVVLELLCCNSTCFNKNVTYRVRLPARLDAWNEGNYKQRAITD